MNRTWMRWIFSGFDKSKVRCFKCQNLGHFARQCQRQTGEPQQPSTFHNSSCQSSSNSASRTLVSTTSLDGSYDSCVHLEDDVTITQALREKLVMMLKNSVPKRIL
ncbi:putative transcription factor interactor and regulator CCHC(Zn) family [Helianthus anomalus]